MCTAVVAESDVPGSVQLISTPFRPSLTLLIINLVISGRLSGVESLEKVNIMVELIISGCDSTRPLGPIDWIDLIKVIAFPLSEITVNCHVCNATDVLQVSSSWSPAWQTGATTGGEISTNPGIKYRSDTKLTHNDAWFTIGCVHNGSYIKLHVYILVTMPIA